MFPKSKRKAVQDKKQLFKEVAKEVGHSIPFIYTSTTKRLNCDLPYDTDFERLIDIYCQRQELENGEGTLTTG